MARRRRARAARSAARCCAASPRTCCGRDSASGRATSTARGLLFERCTATDRAPGPSSSRPYSSVRPRAGRVRGGRPRGRGERCVDEGIEAARDAEDSWGERLLLYPLALVAGLARRRRRGAGRRRGRLLDARAAKGERPGVVRGPRRARPARALRGRPRGRRARARPRPPRLLDAMGFAHPGAFPVLPDAVEALACAGRPAGRRGAARPARAPGGRGGQRLGAGRRRSAARGALMLARGRGRGGRRHARPARPPCSTASATAPTPPARCYLQGRALLRAGQRAQAAEALAARARPLRGHGRRRSGRRAPPRSSSAPRPAARPAR